MGAEFVIIPLLTMVIGLIGGAAAMDAYKTNQWQEKMERKVRRIEKRMEEQG